MRRQLEELSHAGSSRAGSSGTGTGEVPNNLTARLASFIGRQREIEEIITLLASARLLTLTGAGGCGKTQLSLELARRLLGAEPRFDGIFFVSLAAVGDPQMLPGVIATALRVQDGGAEDRLEAVRRSVGGQRILLLLDNCEHLLDASAQAATALLEGCPNVLIVATSREALSVPGEVTLRVPSLSVPRDADTRAAPGTGLERLLEYESVQLFLERARAAKHEFALDAATAGPVAEICRRLDGLPLAIELAAARVRALPVDELARRLARSFALLTGGSRTAVRRQQTLRATIEWSYNLLSEQERLLLQRLSVFSGGWTLEAAEQICTDAAEQTEQGRLDGTEILDLLSSLVEKSLALYESGPAGGRYHLLETVRQHSGEVWLANGDADAARVRGRHLEFFLAVAEREAARLLSPEATTALSALRTDHNNILSAIDWCEHAEGAAEKQLRLCGAMGRFWREDGHAVQGLALCLRALERPDALELGTPRGDALRQAGNLANEIGDFARAARLQEEAAQNYMHVGDEVGAAATLLNRANSMGELGDFREATALYQAALKAAKDLNHGYLELFALNNLLLMSLLQEDRESDEAWGAKALAVAQRLGNPRGISDIRLKMAFVIADRDRYTEARDHVAFGLRVWRDRRTKSELRHVVSTAAHVASREGSLPIAARLIGKAEQLEEEQGFDKKKGALQAVYRQRTMSVVQEALGDERFEELVALGRGMSDEEVVREVKHWLDSPLPAQQSPESA